MAGINNLPPAALSSLFLPAIPVQFDMSAQILSGASPLLPMDGLGFGLGTALNPKMGSQAGAPAAETAKKGGKNSKDAKKKEEPPATGLSAALKAMGWDMDKNGNIKISDKLQKDYYNNLIGNYLSGASQLNASFASFLGGGLI